MQTFDQALFDLCESGLISQEDALRNADSYNELHLKFKLHGKNSGAPEEDSNKLDQLSLHEDKPVEEDPLNT
jgi:twitching motility protein PilU